MTRIRLSPTELRRNPPKAAPSRVRREGIAARSLPKVKTGEARPPSVAPAARGVGLNRHERPGGLGP